MNDILGNEIGRGGFGIVYMMKTDDAKCVKTSTKKSSCRQWSNEYQKIMQIFNKIESHSAFHSIKNVRIIKPIEFKETNDICYMTMPRVFRPEGKDFMKPTIQALLGVKSSRVVYKGRGENIGLEQIREYISSEELDKMSHELGILMGLIHFVAKNDAYDIELYLGKESNSKKCRLYIADFDLSENIISYDKETIERIAWSLDAVPYFPKPNVDIHLFSKFEKAYRHIAIMSGISKEIVDMIFEQYYD